MCGYWCGAVMMGFLGVYEGARARLCVCVCGRACVRDNDNDDGRPHEICRRVLFCCWWCCIAAGRKLGGSVAAAAAAGPYHAMSWRGSTTVLPWGRRGVQPMFICRVAIAQYSGLSFRRPTAVSSFALPIPPFKNGTRRQRTMAFAFFYAL
uniref:Putative secreted protein n=1 Tax=Anopheles triannulatus TaxID=58253 RepID=A0A2M4B4W7_9DIPT